MISFEGMVDELGRLRAVSEGQLKVAKDLTKDDALGALDRLETLQHARPTSGQLTRGALAGALVGPIAATTSRLIGGGARYTPREILGQAASGAVFGGTMPFVRYKTESTAERKMLKDYVNQNPQARLSSQIENKLGV